MPGDGRLKIWDANDTSWQYAGVGETGESGTSGTSGTDGVSGTSGTDGTGVMGTSGTSGTDGTGVMGTSGTSGTNGTSGTSGTDGTGVMGTSGTSGTDGVLGSSGTSGTSGTNGTSGTSGTHGTDGTNFGTSGTSGTDGTSYAWKGAWDSTSSYALNDCITYNGDGYICTEAGTGFTPAIDSTSWDLFVQSGTSGTSGENGTSGVNGTSFVWCGQYDAGSSYNVSDAVGRGGNGYICIQAGTGQDPLTASSYWSLLVQGNLGLLIPNTSSTSAFAVTAAQCCGYIHYLTPSTSCTVTLPAVAGVTAGSIVKFYMMDASVVTVDPDNDDRIVLSGTGLADGEDIANSGAAGDILTLHRDSNSGWTVLEKVGTWSA